MTCWFLFKFSMFRTNNNYFFTELVYATFDNIKIIVNFCSFFNKDFSGIFLTKFTNFLTTLRTSTTSKAECEAAVCSNSPCLGHIIITFVLLLTYLTKL